ncbi:hypothetical protein GCK32_016801 [Trichostrongylus colubriformis]|uniref:C2H2-type domain-containing protein n=1 Tax=Trichostrongylus colubriformis TaxID=6319 RepID=A0AAN8IWL2_TRICO
MDYNVLIDHMHGCLNKSNSSDISVRYFLLGKGPRQCPFCARWIDCKDLVHHVQMCPRKQAVEESQSSSEAWLKACARRERMRQCAFCHRWMDLNILCWHMRRYHGAKIAFAVKDKNTKVTKKKCEEEVVKVLKQKNLLGETERACYSLLCTVCGRRRLDQEELVTHGRKDHGDSQCLVHKRVFRTAMECELWKNQIANTHRTAWVEGGRCRDGPNVVVFYRCSRVSDEDRHGEVDSRDEEPPLTSCTSFLKEFINDDGTIIVRYCTRHISHGLKITDMLLSYSDKEIIADFIRRGLEPSLIRQVLKKQYSSAMRLHWVTERDIEDVSASIRCQDTLEYMDDSLQGTRYALFHAKNAVITVS